MQIKNIHLVNYRGMEDLTVDFGPGVNLIIGDNGAGKSSLLSGISVILDRLFWTTSGIANMRTIRKEDVRFTSSTIGDATDNRPIRKPIMGAENCKIQLLKKNVIQSVSAYFCNARKECEIS